MLFLLNISNMPNNAQCFLKAFTKSPSAWKMPSWYQEGDFQHFRDIIVDFNFYL